MESKIIPCLILMMGLPASGKSSFAKRFKEENEGCLVFEGDEIEQEISQEFSPEKWKESRQILFQRVE